MPRKPYRKRPAYKRFLPTSLFGRALLILLAPVILAQGLAAYVFFERHWDSVQRNMAESLAGEVSLLVDTYRNDPKDFAYMRRQAANMGIHASLSTPAKEGFKAGCGEFTYRKFCKNLRDRMRYAASVYTINQGKDILVTLKLSDNELIKLQTTRKRLASNTTRLLLFWMAATTGMLVLVAVLFLRNQVRPIVELARAAERFGLGQEAEDFTPRGAAEVRQAGRAFITMRDRLRRQMMSRTEMLAGISHDLRTPLTRMQLQIAMAPLHDAQKKTLEEDITEMRHMIQEYLDFARGDVAEPTDNVDMLATLTDVVTRYTQSGKPVYLQYTPDGPIELTLRPQAIRRLLTNLIDNALRYGQRAVVSLESSATFVRVKIEDAGPGIPTDVIEDMFKPFTRLDGSRNSKTGGVGLGLSIARDIAHSHGGEISLENLKDDEGSIRGLQATLRLPKGVR